METFSGRKASQNPYELNSLVEFMQKIPVKKYMEIGARHGDTFHHIMMHLEEGSLGVAVDLPGGLWGTSKSAHHLTKACDNISYMNREVYHYFLDSQSEKTRDYISNNFGDFDLIFIDGDHTLEAINSRADNGSIDAHTFATFCHVGVIAPVS